jgi:hypothetical protein
MAQRAFIVLHQRPSVKSFALPGLPNVHGEGMFIGVACSPSKRREEIVVEDWRDFVIYKTLGLLPSLCVGVTFGARVWWATAVEVHVGARGESYGWQTFRCMG